MLRHIRFRIVSAAVVGFLVAGAAPVVAQEMPQTWQEEMNFRAGPTPFEPLMAFWYELDEMSEIVSMEPITETLLGRDMNLITIADPPVTNSRDALRSGKTIVFMAPSVHGGEVSPKEYFQLVARELVSGDLRSILDDVIVIGLPLVNPDGGEVRRRTNEAGFDMNRDYLKMESQEIRAIVTQIMNEWTPDIHVDGHHGGSAPYVITYQGTLNPAADDELRAYPYDHIFPEIRAAAIEQDYVAFDYSGVREEDGVRGWGSTSVEPRKHHVYTGLTNSIGILLETPRNHRRVMSDGTLVEIPEDERYYHQIQGGVIALTAILRHAAENRSEIRALTTASRMRAIEAGDQAGDPIVLDYELTNRGDEPVWMPDEDADLGYSLQTVPVFLKWEPTRTTTRPVGYLLPPAMASVVPILMDHDIDVYGFREPTTLDAEVYYATSVSRDSYFQGHYLQSVEAEKESESLEVTDGWFWIPTAQSRANLISYLLEPETDDNLITWGWTDHVLRVTEEGFDRRQRIPMMRVTSHQRLPVARLQPFNQFQRNRFFRGN